MRQPRPSWRTKGILLFAVVTLAVAACGGSVASGSSTISAQPTGTVGTATPTLAPSMPTLAASTPGASVVASPGPTPLPQPVAEATLLAGVRADAKVACGPQRRDLPPRAVAGIHCHPRDRLISQVGFYLFGNQDDLLKTYFALLDAHGVQPRSGDCFGAAAGEDAYTPGDAGTAVIADREGCFVDPTGRAHDLATLPGQPVGDAGYAFGGPFVLVVIDGTANNPGKLHTWAWLGNLAAPGNPTVW